MRPSILHGNKFADLGGIELREGMPRGAAAIASQRVVAREGAASAERAIRLQSCSRS